MNTDDTLPPAKPVSAPYPAAAIGWYSTAVLAFLYWLSILDRTIISLLVDPIKEDIGISDVQFGMLHGLAFAVTFSVFGLVAGILADRRNRRLIIFASVAVWSLATAACGMAKSFSMLMLARVGVGVGEAGLNPCATSMISDLFPPSRMTSALALYSLGASVGSGCAYLLGGVLIDMVGQVNSIELPLIGEVKPWQAVFIIIGVPGIVLSLLSFTMPEPRRRGRRSGSQAARAGNEFFTGYPQLFRFIRSRGRFFFHHYAGFGLVATGFVGAAAWFPAHMGREFGWTAGQIGTGLGTVLVVGGALGKLLCGLCVDALYRRGFRDAQFLWYAGCALAATPVGLIAATSANPWIFLAGFTVFQILLSPINAVYVASLNLVTPNELRGTGVAFYSATVGLVALSLGPILIAVFSDYVYGGNAIGLGLATLFLACFPLAALVLLSGRPAMREAVATAELWDNQ